MINSILLTNHVSLEVEDWKRNQQKEVLVFKFLTKMKNKKEIDQSLKTS